MNFTSHWDNVYNTKKDHELGWYEANPEKTLELVSKCNLHKNARILNVGAGTTTLIDYFLDKGYTNILANDISTIALSLLKERVKAKYDYELTCIADDLTQPKHLQNLNNIDLWVDRAVLHFFLKLEEQTAYFNLIKQTVSKNGYVLIAAFALNGAEKCCGLPLQRYDAKMLEEKLGNSFKLITQFNYTYINPFGGERPYIYTLFKRQ